jgi:hypothetical protein
MQQVWNLFVLKIFRGVVLTNLRLVLLANLNDGKRHRRESSNGHYEQQRAVHYESFNIKHLYEMEI